MIPVVASSVSDYRDFSSFRNMLKTVNKSVIETKLIDLVKKTNSYEVANRMLNWYQNFEDGLLD